MTLSESSQVLDAVENLLYCAYIKTWLEKQHGKDSVIFLSFDEISSAHSIHN